MGRAQTDLRAVAATRLRRQLRARMRVSGAQPGNQLSGAQDVLQPTGVGRCPAAVRQHHVVRGELRLHRGPTRGTLQHHERQSDVQPRHGRQLSLQRRQPPGLSAVGPRELRAAGGLVELPRHRLHIYQALQPALASHRDLHAGVLERCEPNAGPVVHRRRRRGGAAADRLRARPRSRRRIRPGRRVRRWRRSGSRRPTSAGRRQRHLGARPRTSVERHLFLRLRRAPAHGYGRR